MPLHRSLIVAIALGCVSTAGAVEVTLKNDAWNIVPPDAGTTVGGFVVGEQAASWLTSANDGKIVAVQVLWASAGGGGSPTVQQAINIYAAGTFPTPGALRASVEGPVLTDGFINEWRFLDEFNTVPISLPILAGERVVVSIQIDDPPNVGAGDASVVRDASNTNNRNALFAIPGGWLNTFGLINGDWVIRAVVDVVAPDLPSGPAPTSGATSISTSVVLDWADTPVARRYNVFLWRAVDSPPGTPTASSLATSTYTPGVALQSGTVYNWTVQSENNNGVTTGPVWSFTTAPGATVDDWTAM